MELPNPESCWVMRNSRRNSVELTSETAAPKFRIKRVGADGNPPLEGQDMQMFHPYPQSVQRKSL